MIRWLILSIGLITGTAAIAADPASKPLFASTSPMRIAIEAPLAPLFSDRSSEVRVPGTLVDPAGNRLPITVAMRGITRRTAEICDFPPLHIRFTTPPPPTSAFAGQGKLKLATHCRKAASAETSLLLEHAAYRMFNRLSPKSIRTRLVTIDYRYPDGKAMIARPGFFIEDLDDAARRNATPRLRAGPKIPIADLNPRDAALYGLFQHMIGNHDWSMRAGPMGKECCHNAEMIGWAGPGRATPIPYDFDYSGLVGAPYAIPPEQLGLNSVKDRKYRGYCRHNDAVREVARTIRASWPAVLAEFDSIPGLDGRARSTARSYLQGFYADIASDAAVETRLISRCVG
ncbi:MAG: hypothetical protein ABIS23_07670 [Sphingomicrobium sp.]